MIEQNLNLKNEDDKKKIVLLAEALSNMNRINILEQLSTGRELSYKEIAELNSMSSSAIGFHLNILFDAELIDISIGKGFKSRNTKVPFKIMDKITINL